MEMRLFFVYRCHTNLADTESASLHELRELLIRHPDVVEVKSLEAADALVIQESVGFKDWRYLPKLLDDPILGSRLGRVYTVNQDDCATGLLKGAYTSLAQQRFDQRRHILIPYLSFPNPLISHVDPVSLPPPTYLASWRGNPKSSPRLREALLAKLSSKPDFRVELTSSWLNHTEDEHECYVELLASGWFALCPRGWSPVTYRIYESLALGRVPVLLADGLVLPKGPNWEAISIQLPEKQLDVLPSLLKERLADAEVMGREGRATWLEYYSPSRLLPGIARSLLDLIHRDLQSPTDHKSERRGLQSLRMAWANKWTPPQRLMRRLRRLMHY